MSGFRQAVYVARCSCDNIVRSFATYEGRAEWVGAHRVKTGHVVGQWIAVD